MSQSSLDSHQLPHQPVGPSQLGQPDNGPSDLLASERGTVAAGCLLTLGSALLTCLMLFINGSLVMAIHTTISGVVPPALNLPHVVQFFLYSMPVVLAVMQWMMIDYVRTRFSNRR